MRVDGIDPAAEQWGTLALATTATHGRHLPHHLGRPELGRYAAGFLGRLSADGKLEERARPSVDNPIGSLAVKVDAAAAARHERSRSCWRGTSPTAQAGASRNEPTLSYGTGSCATRPELVGNYYTTQYRDAWDVVEQTAAATAELEADTLRSSAPSAAATCPRGQGGRAVQRQHAAHADHLPHADGHFCGWEGCGDKAGCCHGTCTHVWNYEQATAFLFGDLARTMREVEFMHCHARRRADELPR